MNTKSISDIDINEFWNNTEYAKSSYISEALDNDLLALIESQLRYKLPNSYVEFMKKQNGGIPFYTDHKTTEETSWAYDHIAIHGIFGIGNKKSYSLCGEKGSKFWIEHWGYPNIGVYFADCPSAGHDMLCLDYRNCIEGKEPKVVHVDQEFDYKITHVADSFEQFILGLEDFSVNE
ncbi:SMI1/KNR4 family protein [Methylomonas sp. BW4-1]|uniref:SMI1/KNR4 family protein n=1 Tax=Methylomonas sp. BW4-1 TaxID=3376685 RepID=UPI0040418E25